VPRAAATNGSTILIIGDILTVLDDRAQLIQQSPSPFPGAYQWSAASNGDTYEIATSRYSAGRNWVVALTLDARGNVLHTLSLPDELGQPRIVVTSGKYRIFCESVSTVPQIVTFDASSDPAPVSPFIAMPDDYAVIGTGSDYLLALKANGAVSDEIEVYRASGDQIEPGATFSTTGNPLQARTPSFGVAGDAVLFAWSGGSELHAVILDTAGKPRTATFDLTRSASEQHLPFIATGGANDLVVWQETTGIYAARVTPDGVPLDGRGISLSTTGSVPQAIYDGSQYVVSWLGDFVVGFRWIDPESGTVTASATVDTPSATSYFVGRDAAGLVLFYTDFFTVKAQRVGVSGAIGPALTVTTASDVEKVSAAWNGNEWLVVWNDLTWHYPEHFGLPLATAKAKAVRLLESLSPVDAIPMEIGDSSTDLGPLASTNGDDFLVAWSASSDSHVRTVSRTGTLGDPTLLATGATQVKSAAWDGEHYAVAYTIAGALMLTHVGAGDQLVISSAPPYQYEVSIAAAPGRPLRAAYTRVATAPQYGYVWRVFTRDLVYARRRMAPH
jgi:hypothetical protein